MRRSKQWPLHGYVGKLVFCLSVFSAPAYALDILEVYSRAVDQDKTFSAARNAYDAERQKIRQANGLYYPSFNIAYEKTETEQVINRSDNDVFGSGESDFPVDDLTFTISQPVFRWDFFSERKVAKAEVRQAEFTFVAAEQELILRTAEAYLLELSAREAEQTAAAELEAVTRQLRLSEKRLEVGLASPIEVHESSARMALNQSELIESQNGVVDREEGLRQIAGALDSQLAPLKVELEMLSPDPQDAEMWIARALENNLSIKSREAAAEVAEAEYKRRKADRYPTIDLEARFNNRDTGGSLFGGGSDVDTDDIVLRANWTVFQGGVLRAKIKEALYKRDVALDELALEQNNVRRDTRKAYLAVVSSIARSEALKSSRDAQLLATEAKRKGFETGVNSNIEVLDAERDYFFAQRDYLGARYEYLLGMLNLKRQTGSLGLDDLTRLNTMLQEP